MTLTRSTALALLVALLALFNGPIPSASAAAKKCYRVTKTVFVKGGVRSVTTLVCPPGSVQAITPSAAGTSTPVDNTACGRKARSVGLSPTEVCSASDLAKSLAGQPAPGQIAAAVWRLRLPPSGLHIEPVKGRTLVNLATNFYATNSPIERTVTLLGHRIRVRVWASSYVWSFGDGRSRRTTSPGAAYPDLLVTHCYLRKGVVRPGLSTVYAAEYRLGQQAWRPVPGSASIASPAQRLEVVTATPRLTDPYG